jgi:hypothetical protein
MTPEEKDYYLDRAEIELTLGDEAENRRAAWAHFQLAGRYLDLVYRGPANDDAEPTPAPDLRAI